MIPTLLYRIHSVKYNELYKHQNKEITLEPFPLKNFVRRTSDEYFPGIGLFAIGEMNGPYVRFDEDLTSHDLANFLIQNMLDFYSTRRALDEFGKACQTVQYAREFIIFLYEKNYIKVIDNVWHLNNE